MRTKYEFNKFPVAAVTLSIIGLVLAVLATSFSITANDQGFYGDAHLGGLAIIEVVAAVLFLAGLTTGKGGLVKIISIILTVGLVITSFVLAIVKLTNHDVMYFSIALMMLIASVLELIYFLSVKGNGRIAKLYMVASITFAALVALYGVIYTVMDVIDFAQYNYPVHIDNDLLLFGMAFISALPVISYISLAKEEEPQQNPEA